MKGPAARETHTKGPARPLKDIPGIGTVGFSHFSRETRVFVTTPRLRLLYAARRPAQYTAAGVR